MYRSNVVKLYPTKTQQKQIHANIHQSRYVYNWALALRMRYYSVYNKSLPQYRITKQLTKLKQRTKTAFLCEADSLTLMNAVLTVNIAYKNFFQGRGYPKFKSRKTSTKSFKVHQTKELIQTENSTNLYVKIAKTTPIKQRGLRDEYSSCAIKNITITHRRDNTYTASILFSVPDVPDVKHKNITGAVGIDVGVKHFIHDSNNTVYKPIDISDLDVKMQKHIVKLNKTKPGSKNRHKCQVKINRIHQKIKNRKKEQIEQITHKYRNKHCVVEELNIKSMTKKEGSYKSSLNRSVLSQSWHLFFTRLSDKTTVTKVNPAYTSLMCNRCNNIDKQNRKNQAEFICTKCNLKINADYNASINILNLGNPEDCLEASLARLAVDRKLRMLASE